MQTLSLRLIVNISVEVSLPYYNLQRVKDQKIFTAFRSNDERALFYFSILVGEPLTFAGMGAAPFLLEKRQFSALPVDATTPVYRKDPA
jgi:hypothetical protein